MKSSIKPALKAAIRSLDLQLDAEIARYHLHKASYPHELNDLTHNKLKNPQKPLGEHLGQGYTLVKATEVPLSSSESLTGDRELVASLVNQSSDSSQVPSDDAQKSSEELRSSLIDEEPSQEKTQRWQAILFTPLGIGSLLLLLVATVLLSMARLVPERSPTTAQNATETESSQPEPTPESSFSQNPNLMAEDTSIELENLSSIKPKSSKSPTPKATIPPSPPTPEPAQTPATSAPAAKSTSNSDLAEALIPPSLRSQPNQPSGVAPPTTPVTPTTPDTSSPASPPPTPTSVPTLAPPPPQPIPSQLPTSQTPVQNTPPETVAVNPYPGSPYDNYYYVLVDYTDAESIRRARAVVSDAYLTNFPQGIKIQMGAFDRQEDADILVERLKQQGIAASVYHPQKETTN